MKRFSFMFLSACGLLSVMFFAGSGVTTSWAQEADVDVVPFEASADLSENTQGAEGEEIAEAAPVIRRAVNFPVKTLSGDPLVEEMVRRIINADLDVHPRQIGSLFLSNAQKDLIANARLGLMTRPPKDGDTDNPTQRDPMTGSPALDGPRELTVGGIIYNSSSEWTVWLNGQKITPKRLPPEVYDIEVYKNYIKLKWHDPRTNKIYPVKLKSNQRFNIDTRIFLPG